MRAVTVRKDLFALNVFYRRFAMKFGLIEKNPVKLVTKPSDKDSRCMRVLTETEEKAYFVGALKLEELTLHDIAKLMRDTGAREADLYPLRKTDVDLVQGQIQVASKTQAGRRTLDLTAESKGILRRRLHDLTNKTEWVFPSPRYPGRHIAKLNGQHDKVCRETGVSFRLYDLRHTFATRMVEAGCDLVTLAGILGHNSLRMVMRYAHPTAEHRKKAMQRYEKIWRPKRRAAEEA